jgi:hypothetical protein
MMLRDSQKRWRYLKEMCPDQECFARMEEFLFWIAILSRYCS